MKKITLTEEQLRYIIAESLVGSAYLNESVWSNAGGWIKNRLEKDFSKCRTTQDYLRVLALYVSAGFLTIAGAKTFITSMFPEQTEVVMQQLENEVNKTVGNQEETADFNQEQETQDQNQEEEDAKLHQQKVEEVNNLMHYVAKLNGRENLLDLSAENIVSQCEKYNFPLPLLLAQAHIESHFGTTPRAQRTNSVFSVGSYDNGKNACMFNNKDESVEHYIKTMQNYYLNNKTVDDLLTPGNFVNGIGNRYSSNKNYEQEVRKTMNGLIKKYCPNCF